MAISSSEFYFRRARLTGRVHYLDNRIIHCASKLAEFDRPHSYYSIYANHLRRYYHELFIAELKFFHLKRLYKGINENMIPPLAMSYFIPDSQKSAEDMLLKLRSSEFAAIVYPELFGYNRGNRR